MGGRNVTGHRTTQRLFVCCFDNADNNNDDDDGHCETYNDTHLETSQHSCLAQQHEPTFISFHLFPPEVRWGIGAMKQGSLPHILDPVSVGSYEINNETHLAHSVCSTTEALGRDGQVVC